jgi:hypothetical protein
MAKFPTNEKLTGIVQSFIPDQRYSGLNFFSNDTCDTDAYGFDKITGNRGIATHRDPESAAGIVKTTAKDRTLAKLHTIREKKRLSEVALRWLDAAGKKMPEKALERVARELADLDDIFSRTHNKMAWDLMRTGIVDVVGEDAASYDFGLTHTAAAAVDWDTPATATPLDDLIAAKEAIRQDWGADAVEVYMSTKALRHMMGAADTRAQLDSTTLDQFARTGKIELISDLNITIEDGGYRDSANAFKHYLSDDGVEGNIAIVKAAGPVGLFMETKPVDSEAPDSGLYGKFVKTWEEKDPTGRWMLETQTAICGLTMPNKLFAITLW